jgi:transposase
MVASQDLATEVHDADRRRPSRRHGCGRQHLCEGPSLGCRRPKKATQDQAIGVSRGGRSTKIHLATDLLGRPIAIHLTPGQHSDSSSVEALLARIGACKRLIADRAYDAKALRQRLHDSGIKTVIPGKKNRLVTIRHDKGAYKQRWRIEATIGRLKDFRRVATRYDKIARTFGDTIALTTIYMFWL